MTQPEQSELKAIAAEGIFTCLQDAIEALEQNHVSTTFIGFLDYFWLATTCRSLLKYFIYIFIHQNSESSYVLLNNLDYYKNTLVSWGVAFVLEKVL